MAEAKQQLQQRKEEVKVMVEDMEKTGRELARSEYFAVGNRRSDRANIGDQDIKMSNLKRPN